MQHKKPNGLFLLDEFSYANVYGGNLARDFACRLEIPNQVLNAANWQSRRDLVEKTEIILGGWNMPVLDSAFLKCSGRLKAVFYSGGSVKSIVTEAFWESGIPLVSASMLNAIPVGEYSLAMIILGLKHVWKYALAVQRTGKALPRLETMPGGYRSVVGIISLGSAGRRTAELLRVALDVKVLAYDPFCTTDDAKTLGVELVSLEELFRNADVVTIHTPLITETVGLITRTHLASMRMGATFINTARGEIIREDEMVQVLTSRPDLMAVLDVLTNEPLLLDSPLSQLPNVILTPHIAGSMGMECRRLGRGMLDELDRFLSGKPLLWQRTRQQMVCGA